MKKVLSQEEIDAVFQGTSTEAASETTPDVTFFDLSHLDRIPKSQFACHPLGTRKLRPQPRLQPVCLSPYLCGIKSGQSGTDLLFGVPRRPFLPELYGLSSA